MGRKVQPVGLHAARDDSLKMYSSFRPHDQMELPSTNCRLLPVNSLHKNFNLITLTNTSRNTHFYDEKCQKKVYQIEQRLYVSRKEMTGTENRLKSLNKRPAPSSGLNFSHLVIGLSIHGRLDAERNGLSDSVYKL